MRPRLLDGFCKAGGAGYGYDKAGFDVTGFDIEDQPNYPFAFFKADAMEVLADRDFLATFDAIHVSPICQGHASVTDWRGSRSDYPDLLTPSLALLEAQPVPWVAENVPEAPIRPDYLLCGTQFGLRVKRHRAFQRGNWSTYDLLPRCDCYRNPELIPFEHKDERAFADAMGCTWMTNLEGRQAVPPAFAEYIGAQMLASITQAGAA
jgi:DNA (cytosine-5)-methyltransferase 1